MHQQMQQGDVLIQRIDRLPKEAKKIAHDGILAHGEATGHKHRLEDIENVSFYETDGKFYFQVKDRAVILRHEEHKAITIEPGIFEFGRVQEKDWLSDMTRNVTD